MIGSLVLHDLRLVGRRDWLHRLRWAYAGWLLLVLVIFLLPEFLRALVYGRPQDAGVPYAAAVVDWLSFFFLQQTFLLFVTAPVLAAGSVTEEKARGTLQLLLITDLTATEILAARLLSRVLQVIYLALPGLPLLASVGCFAGLEPPGLLALLAALLMQAVGLAAAGLLASVLARRTSTAVLYLLTTGLAALTVTWLLGVAGPFRPLALLGPAWSAADGAELVRRLSAAALAWGGLAVGCFALAALGLRPLYLRQSLRRRPESSVPSAERPPVGGQPLRWKERYLATGATHPAVARVRRWLTPRAVFALTLLAFVGTWVGQALHRHTPARVWGAVAAGEWAGVWGYLSSAGLALDHQSFLVLGLGVLCWAAGTVTIRAAGSVSGERERQSWDVLLLTPLEPRQLLRGKLWGIIDAVRPYLRAYFLPALGASFLAGGLAVAWTALLWLATWVAVYFLGASALYCSVRSLTTWRSLLGALGTNLTSVFLRYWLTGLPAGAIAVTVANFVGLLLAPGPGWPWPYFVVIFVVVSAGWTLVQLFAEAEYRLSEAEKWVEENERVPQVRPSSPPDPSPADGTARPPAVTVSSK